MTSIVRASVPVTVMALSVAFAPMVLIALEFTPSQVTVIGMIVGLITSIIASVTSVIIARQAKVAIVETKAAVSENTKLTEKTSHDVETVKKDVDGIKSRDSARIAELEREAVSLKQQLLDSAKTAIVLAQAKTPQTVVLTSPTPPKGDTETVLGKMAEASETAAQTAAAAAEAAAATEATLKEVAKHTEATAENTAKEKPGGS